MTTRAGAHAAASRPPLIAERCLRTQFISSIAAPLFSSALLIACFSASVTPAAGKASSDEAPPDIRQIDEIVFAQTVRELEDSRRGAAAGLVGNRMRRLHDLDPRRAARLRCQERRRHVFVAGDDQAAQRCSGRPRGLERRRHRAAGLAGTEDERATARQRRQEARERRAGQRLRDRGVEQRAQEVARLVAR